MSWCVRVCGCERGGGGDISVSVYMFIFFCVCVSIQITCSNLFSSYWICYCYSATSSKKLGHFSFTIPISVHLQQQQQITTTTTTRNNQLMCLRIVPLRRASSPSCSSHLIHLHGNTPRSLQLPSYRFHLHHPSVAGGSGSKGAEGVGNGRGKRKRGAREGVGGRAGGWASWTGCCKSRLWRR